MTKRLSREAYERATRFMHEDARPLERALFAYHFESGRRTSVLAALVPYQNPDGGFGHGLEPDLRAPASSVIATITALDIFRRIRADEDTPGLPAALAYLMSEYDVETERWPIVSPAVEDAPHAPWWSHADSAENFRGFWANPRASVVAYLQQFSRLAPSPFTEGARQAVVEDLMRYSQRMEMHDLMSFVDLLETDGLPREHYESVLDKLKRALPHSVVMDPAQWGEYGFHSPSRIKEIKKEREDEAAEEARRKAVRERAAAQEAAKEQSAAAPQGERAQPPAEPELEALPPKAGFTLGEDFSF